VTEFVRDRATLWATPEDVWALIEDPAALARVLPGAESVEAVGPGRFRGVLASRIQFMTVRAEVEASYHDADPPHHLRLQLVGRPRGLVGSFSASIPFDLEPLVGPTGEVTRTEIRYSVDLTLSGRLAAFGAPLLRDTLRRQVSALVANVERELATRGAGDTATGTSALPR
jgi:carbon monoxide dehydrogenase subunit G